MRPGRPLPKPTGSLAEDEANDDRDPSAVSGQPRLAWRV